MSQKTKKIITSVLLVVAVIAGIVVTVVFFQPILNIAVNPQDFRDWVNAHPVVAELAYIGLVMLQIVFAFLPGEPLEIAAGFAFGAVKGTLLCILASTLGSMTVFLLVRLLGKKIVTVFFSEDKLSEVKFLKTTPKRDILYFIIFLIPGTPKDLLCYFAGLTNMKVYTWLLICSIGRIPSIVTSTLPGDALGNKQYLVGIIALAVTLAFSGIGLLIYYKIIKKRRLENDPNGSGENNAEGSSGEKTQSVIDGEAFEYNTNTIPDDEEPGPKVTLPDSRDKESYRGIVPDSSDPGRDAVSAEADKTGEISGDQDA